LVAELKAIAHADGKSLDEIAENAVQRFLEDRRRQELVSYGKDKAANLGINDDDVLRLIAESRHRA